MQIPLKVVARSVAAAISRFRSIRRRLREVDETAEPVRAALAAARSPDALGELQSGRHVA